MTSTFSAARAAWYAAADFRARRDRCKRYTYGDQWSDIVPGEKGQPVVEYDFVCRSGRQPLVNNMIRQLVKTVIGRYRSACSDQNIYDGRSRPYIADNSLFELDCRLLEEFLISGCAIQRIDRSDRASSGVVVDNVDSRMFFVNPYRDPRGRDIRLIGMLHDLTMPEIMARFARSGSKSASVLARLLRDGTGSLNFDSPSRLGLASEGCTEFDRPQPGYCRLAEVWTFDNSCRPALRHDRQRGTIVRRPSMRLRWHCRWYAMDGTLIDSYDSPYAHRSHPFAIKMYPLTDGEVHSFVEDIIDQQRFINRLIVMVDHMLGSSAKGVLLFPAGQKPKDTDWKDIAEIWSRSNGVIPISGNKYDELPKQIVTSTADTGAYEMLSLQLKLLDNISGVSDIVAGRSISPSTGNALYESQLRNSIVALSDLLEAFGALRAMRDHKAKHLTPHTP